MGIIKSQIDSGLKGLDEENLKNLIIAYEPVWAIGTGKTATPDQAEEVHKEIRKYLEENFDKNFADKTRILYGGSVNSENVDSLMAQDNIDGALVGGKSLDAKSFLRIINFE